MLRDMINDMSAVLELDNAEPFVLVGSANRNVNMEKFLEDIRASKNEPSFLDSKPISSPEYGAVVHHIDRIRPILSVVRDQVAMGMPKPTLWLSPSFYELLVSQHDNVISKSITWESFFGIPIKIEDEDKQSGKAWRIEHTTLIGEQEVIADGEDDTNNTN